MNDPHIESLVYRLVTPETLVFKNPPALHHSTPGFDLRLEDGRLTVLMNEHHPSVESAWQVIKPFLRSWELDWAVRQGRLEMTFEYQTAKIVDRNPPPPGASLVIRPAAAEFVLTGSHVTLILTSPTYPLPPQDFVASPDVEVLWYRYEMYRQGKESLPGMGFFCLTWVEALYGGLPEAARQLGISREVLTALQLEIPDTPGHIVRMFEIRRTFPDKAPTIEGLKVVEEVARGMSDLIAGNGHSAGYTVWRLENGDLTFGQFQTAAHAVVNPDGSRKNLRHDGRNRKSAGDQRLREIFRAC